MKVFIAEKPALARVIATALGSGVSREGYIQCGTDAVTWCIGHILELAAPEVHNPSYAKWKAADLPLKLRPPKYQPKASTAGQFRGPCCKQGSKLNHSPVKNSYKPKTLFTRRSSP